MRTQLTGPQNLTSANATLLSTPFSQKHRVFNMDADQLSSYPYILHIFFCNILFFSLCLLLLLLCYHIAYGGNKKKASRAHNRTDLQYFMYLNKTQNHIAIKYPFYIAKRYTYSLLLLFYFHTLYSLQNSYIVFVSL